MTTYLGKSCSFCLPRVPFVNCRQFMYLAISLLVLRAGYGIWLYQFLIIAYLFTLDQFFNRFYRFPINWIFQTEYCTIIAGWGWQKLLDGTLFLHIPRSPLSRWGVARQGHYDIRQLKWWSRSVLFLFCVALWFILRGTSCLKVFPCSLPSCCFIPFIIVVSSLREEGAGQCASRAFVCLFCTCYVLSCFSSSWCRGLAEVCDCNTPWTFLLTFYFYLR